MASTIYERFVDNFNTDYLEDFMFHMELWNLRLKNDKQREILKFLKNNMEKDIDINGIEVTNKTNKEILLNFFSMEELKKFQLDNNWLENKLKHVKI